jgi:hypothetical protein
MTPVQGKEKEGPGQYSTPPDKGLPSLVWRGLSPFQPSFFLPYTGRGLQVGPPS